MAIKEKLRNIWHTIISQQQKCLRNFLNDLNYIEIKNSTSGFPKIINTPDNAFLLGFVRQSYKLKFVYSSLLHKIIFDFRSDQKVHNLRWPSLKNGGYHEIKYFKTGYTVPAKLF